MLKLYLRHLMKCIELVFFIWKYLYFDVEILRNIGKFTCNFSGQLRVVYNQTWWKGIPSVTFSFIFLIFFLWNIDYLEYVIQFLQCLDQIWRQTDTCTNKYINFQVILIHIYENKKLPNIHGEYWLKLTDED